MSKVTDNPIDGSSLTLEKWLKVLFSMDRDNLFPSNTFPTDNHKKKYLETVHQRPDEEVKRLLGMFLLESGVYGADKLSKTSLEFWKKNDVDKYNEIKKHRYWRLIDELKIPWEGTQWITELLPFFPKEAINAISSFFIARCTVMTDQQLTGLSDAMEIIREKYINAMHPRNVMSSLTSREFEYLIAQLYEQMEYSVKITKATRDGGIDVIASKVHKGEAVSLGIECKHIDGKVGIDILRGLLGVISKGKVAKGIVATTSTFSQDSIRYAKDDPRLELLNFKDLNILLNKNLGTEWPRRLDSIIATAKLEIKTANL